MPRAEAIARARRLSAEHEDRATHRWIARERDGGSWDVAKVRLPDVLRRPPLTETVGSKPKPPEPDDPRPAYLRNAPGAYG